MEDDTVGAGTLDGVLPWTHSCFVCGQDNPHGLQLKSHVCDGAVELVYTTRERDLGWRHIVHGGIVMTLLDEVMTWAAILKSRRPCVAAEMSTRLRKPIRVGDTLTVRGTVEGGKGRLLLAEATASDAEGTVMATATGKYVAVAGAEMSGVEEDFVQSPDAIDPSTIMAV